MQVIADVSVLRAAAGTHSGVAIQQDESQGERC